MAATDLDTEFVGRRKALFGLALRTTILTIVTLGLYRFWMKTRLRRWYWSAIRPGGQPLEYAGEPLEKLLGFLIAVVVMAFYIGVVNLLLMFASFSLLNSSIAAYAMSFIGVLPIVFFARYRARRYILARTRWRGIRFGADAGAWGYAWRCLAHWLLTIVSLGLLLPRQTFYLEKYRADRTQYGSASFTQGGTWRGMYGAMTHQLIGVLGTGFLSLVGFSGAAPEALYGLILSIPWVLYGWVSYRVRSFQYLTNHKELGEVGFDANPRPRRVLWIYLRGWFVIGLAAAILGGAVLVAVLLAIDPSALNEAAVQSGPRWLYFAVAVPFYFALFTFYGVLSHVMLTLPLTVHYAETLTILRGDRISDVLQRDRDDFAEAEGFADALDVGAAF
ncbi:MAG: DUF898 family protein [Pseudoruegeria sp.]